MEGQESAKEQSEASSPKRLLAVTDKATFVGTQFFLYVPQELSDNSAFPFRPGTPLILEVRPESLVIRADEHEKSRVPFLPPNSSTCWLKGTWRIPSDTTE